MAGVTRVKCVEHAAEASVECRQFDDIGVVDDADGDVVVEVDRARVARRDLLRLEARLRKNQHLRVDPDA